MDTGTLDSDHSDGSPSDAGDVVGDIVEDVVSVNWDGQVNPSEVEGFCQAWQSCDSQTFQNSFSGIDDCTTQTQEYLDYYLQYYEDNVDQACADAFETFLECQVSTYVCAGGSFEIDDQAETNCYEDYSYYEDCYQ